MNKGISLSLPCDILKETVSQIQMKERERRKRKRGRSRGERRRAENHKGGVKERKRAKKMGRGGREGKMQERRGKGEEGKRIREESWCLLSHLTREWRDKKEERQGGGKGQGDQRRNVCSVP